MLAYGELILKVNTLECVVKVQQKQLDAFRSGERYLKLQKDFRRYYSHSNSPIATQKDRY